MVARVNMRHRTMSRQFFHRAEAFWTDEPLVRWPRSRTRPFRCQAIAHRWRLAHRFASARSQVVYAVRIEALAYDGPLVLVVAGTAQESGGALDIGEEKGDRLDSRIVRDVQLRRSIILSGKAKFH